MLPEYGLFGWVRQPQGAAIKTAAPTNTYPCADGRWLCIAGNSDLIFRRLMAAIGRPELAEDPRFRTNGDRCANVKELDAAIAAWSRTPPPPSAWTASGRATWCAGPARRRARTTISSSGSYWGKRRAGDAGK